jgi:hypothetical protein
MSSGMVGVSDGVHLPRRRAGTRADYESMLRLHIRPHFGAAKVPGLGGPVMRRCKASTSPLPARPRVPPADRRRRRPSLPRQQGGRRVVAHVQPGAALGHAQGRR